MSDRHRRVRAVTARVLVGIRPALVVLVVLAIPALLGQDPYYVGIASDVIMFSVPALGAWLLIQSGLFSFGQGLFASIGAYTTTIFLERVGGSFWLAFVLGGLVAAAFAALVAFPFLRTRAITFSVLTMVALLATEQVIVLTPDFTGSGAGLIAEPFPVVEAFGRTMDFRDPTVNYYLIAFFLLLFLGFVYRLQRSGYLRTLRAAGQSDVLAECVGVHVKAYRASVFVAAALFTGWSGAFSSASLQVAHPKVWGLFPSIFIVTYAILGGRQTMIGPILGAALVIGGTALVPSWDVYQPIAVGAALIVVVTVLPDGLASLLPLARRQFERAVGVVSPKRRRAASGGQRSAKGSVTAAEERSS